MAEPTYFQWQNKFLLETIYPRRNRKLADFLIYCREIELWEEFKDKDLTEEEVHAYREDRDRAVITAYKSYKTEYEYFQKGDVRTAYMGKYQLQDETELAPLKELHSIFQKNLTDRQTVRREKVLVAYYVTVWQQRIQSKEEEIKRLERRLAVMHPEHSDRTAIDQQIKRLKDVTLSLLNEELARLLTFLSTFNKVEKRKLEYHQKREVAAREIESTRVRLNAVRSPLQGLEAKAGKLAADLARLKSPPQREPYENYFFTDDVQNDLSREFPHVDPALLGVIGGIHKRLASDLRALKGTDVRRIKIGDYIRELQDKLNGFLKEVTRLELELGSTQEGQGQVGSKQGRLDMLRSSGLKAVETELDKLTNYHAAIEYEKKTPADLAKPIQDTERELKRLRDQVSSIEKQVAPLEQDLKAKQSILNMSELGYLVSFSEDQPVAMQDIVRGKVERYKAELEEKIGGDRPEQEIQQELLEEIVQRFLEKPREYPLWLQYMVIHFSGMRYATAHGSWADPKDLLKSLRTSALQKKFRLIARDEDAVEAMSEERLATYESPDPSRAPRLALATDEKWKAKIATHLQGLRSAYRKSHALFELLLDEENYEIEALDPANALERLKELREGANGEQALPDWMWKEIVKLTDLRLQEAKDPNWNKLTAQEQDEKNEARYAEFREIMNKWKQEHLTGWREEHDRSNRLIVTSSVCNEVAEQIQHLRGHTPSGGLTGIVDWYMKVVSEDKVPGSPRPYFLFVKEGAEENYREGANILWLRFVHELPNPWRVAKPLSVNGDRLIPEKYRRPEGKDGEWAYFESDVITRKRTRVVEKRTYRDQQWLRWMHAATVAKVAETADGPVVLTFETALPYDDPTVSAVGIFKHDRRNLMWDGGEDSYNGSFIAYLPQGEIPANDLEEMLDWNKILRREVMTPAQLEEYRKKYIR
jgi:hypothetical protein